MLRTKQIGTLSQCARSFFLSGSRSGTADGSSCNAEDEACISKKSSKSSGILYQQTPPPTVVPGVASVEGKPSSHYKAESSGKLQSVSGLSASNSLHSDGVGLRSGDLNDSGHLSITVTEHLVKASVATVEFLSDIVNYKLPLLDAGGVAPTYQNSVVDSTLYRQSHRRGHVIKVSPKSSVDIEGQPKSNAVSRHGLKSNVKGSDLVEGFQRVSATKSKNSGTSSSAGNTKGRTAGAGFQRSPSVRAPKQDDHYVVNTKLSASAGTSRPKPVFHDPSQSVTRKEKSHQLTANSKPAGRVPESKLGQNLRYVEKVYQQTRPVKISGGFNLSNRAVGQVHQILEQWKWGPEAEEALANFGFQFDAYQGNQVLKMLKDPSVALGFFYWLKRQPGFKHDEHSYTTMVGILGKARQFGAVKRLLDEMTRDGCQPNVVTYNRLIHGYGSANYLDEAMKVFRRMQEVGCTPDRVTYCTLMDIHAKAGFLEVALDMYGRMQAAGLSPDTFTYSVMINCLGKAGHLSSAYKLFCDLTSQGCVPNLITYNIMIALQAKARNYHCALKLYRDMQNAGFCPDKVTYSIVMEVLGHCGYLSEAEALFDEMKRGGRAPDEPIYGLLVDLWGKAGNIDKARSWYGLMLEAGLRPNVPTCNSLLSAFLRANQFFEAENLLQNMLRMGLSPSLQTYTLLLSCCTEAQYHSDMILCSELMGLTGHAAHTFLLTMPAAGPDGQNVRDHASWFFDLIHTEDRESKRGLVDAVVDFLHKSGLKDEAGSVWEVAAQKNVYPDAVKEKSSSYWLINLHVMSDGTAVIALSRTLAWFRRRLLSSGVGPNRIDIVTGWGRRSRVTGSSLVRQSVMELLDVFRFPFFTQNGNTGCFVGCGEPLNSWLLHPFVERMHLL